MADTIDLIEKRMEIGWERYGNGLLHNKNANMDFKKELVEELLDAVVYAGANVIKNTPRVTGFLGRSANRPTPISEKEVAKILSQMEEGIEKPRPKVLFEVGEMVRVKDGPFADFNGNVEEVNYEKSKVRVSVAIFGRSTPVELDFSQVEKT